MAQGVEHVPSHKKQVQKHFYQRFQLEYSAFRHDIQGIASENEQRIYATLMLRRLMILYFLQSKCLLDYDKSYLSNRLRLIQSEQGKDHFYRSYLIPLFHNFLCKSIHQSAIDTFIGNVPALALPLFQMHPLEYNLPNIQIPDDTFTHLFTFFDRYQWKLEGRIEGRNSDELYSEILGNIFEQQINQKQIGAYYTKDDVTTYIATNTILPYLLHTLAVHYPEEFAPGSVLWQLLQDNPEQYIPTTLQSKQYLPKETKREYAERHTRYHHLYTQLRTGQIQTIDDFITCNLDTARFVQDSIAHWRRPELLLTFYRELEQMSILDPTCGSGAFLCAAVNTLEPLYTTCLQRLQSITDNDTHYSLSNTSLNACFHKEGLDTHHTILNTMKAFPTQRHFILNTILSKNLHGVDIMEEATDLCRLRLFLALVACSERIEDVQPFLSIQWNIVTGNALTGTIHNLNLHPQGRGQNLPRPLAPDTHTQQDQEMTDFHWLKTFSTITKRGGFNVIIGNPPYVEYSKVRQNYIIQGYETENCGNLYAAVLERSLTLCHPEKSYLGLIVPLSICGGERFAQLRRTITSQLAKLWIANFEIFPSRLFDGAFQRLSIVIAQHGPSTEDCTICTTRIQRWYTAERPHLLGLMGYTRARQTLKADVFPKLASPLQETILHKLIAKAGEKTIASVLFLRKTKHFVYYQEATNYWMKATCLVPYYKKNGTVMEPPHGRFLYFKDERTARVVMALMNSSLFYLWFATFSDGFHLSHGLVKDFPLGEDLCEQEELKQLAISLEEDIRVHVRLSTRNTKTHLIELEEYRMSASKELLDEIDGVLGRYYGLSKKEMEFVVEYDGKYRMGREG